MFDLGVIAASQVPPSGGGSFAFQTSAVDATDGTSYSFASIPIGTASATRRVVVAVGWASAAAVTLSSATIGGVSATVDADSGNTGNGRRLYFISAVVASGTTATVALTLSGTVVRIGVGVWTLPSGSATGQTSVVTTNTASGSLTVTTAVNDWVLAAAFVSGTSGTITMAWTDATERYDEQIENTFNTHTGADVVAVGTSTVIGYASSGGAGLHTAPKVAVAYA